MAARPLVVAGWIALTLFAIVAADWCWRFVQATRPAILIKITVPKDFRGLIVITETPNASQSSKVVDGAVRWTVPESGVLKVDSVSPFFQLHNIQCTDASGVAYTKHVDGGNTPGSTLTWAMSGPWGRNKRFTMSACKDSEHALLNDRTDVLRKYIATGKPENFVTPRVIDK